MRQERIRKTHRRPRRTECPPLDAVQRTADTSTADDVLARITMLLETAG